MKTSELTAKENELIELLRADPALAEHVGEVLAVVRMECGGAWSADAVEERLVEPLRALGLNVLGGWARRSEQKEGARLRATDPSARPRAKKKFHGTAASEPLR